MVDSTKDTASKQIATTGQKRNLPTDPKLHATIADFKEIQKTILDQASNTQVNVEE
jgi:hypothetical protein